MILQVRKAKDDNAILAGRAADAAIRPMIEIGALQEWVGRTMVATDLIAPAHARKLAATLDHAGLPDLGDPLPPLWHWIYFTPEAAQSELDVDGHPRLGGFMPPVPLPSRMWAGGRLKFHHPLTIGEEVSRETQILKIALKSGRHGDLVFVTLLHRLYTAQGLAISEEQDVVYRQPPAPDATPAEPAASTQLPPCDWRDPVDPDPVLLFRYSALTFNAHRIHYDLPYGRDDEDYPGLVVQGPLTATLLADRLASRDRGRLTDFAFRGQQPLFAQARMHVCGQAGAGGHYDLWAETPTGGKAMIATAQIES